VRRAKSDATQKLEKSKRRESAWWAEETRRALGLSVVAMASRFECSTNTIDAHEDEEIGSMPDHRRRALEDLLRERGLLEQVNARVEERKRRRGQPALRTA
jgi:hypothetical protein